jgi:hypothetical protein
MNLEKMFGLVKKHKNEIISDEMAKEMGFTQEVLNIIKQVTNNSIQPFNTNDLYNDGFYL